MPWQQLVLTCQRDAVDALNAQCDLLGALSVTLQDHGDEPLFSEKLGESPLWQETDMCVLFEKGVDTLPIQSYLKEQPGVVSVRAETIEDQDWVRKSRDSFTPLQFAKNVWVCPSWCELPDSSAHNVIIDPGLAFGTGTHETTGLCLSWLAEQNIAGKAVVDFGCGSGVLGLTALKLGASSVWGVDNDPQAIRASEQNQSLNPDVADRFQLCMPGELPEMQADIVLANILAAPLVALAPTLAALVSSGGVLLLSGILADQESLIRAAYSESFKFQQIKEHSGWLLCILEKNP